MPNEQIATTALAAPDSDKLIAIARLLARQAALELVLQQQRISDPQRPVGGA